MRNIAATLALALAASPALADNAVARGGGSSGGSSSAGEHHSSGVSSSSSSGGSSGSSSSDGGSHSSSSSTTAQHRHPRAGTGTGGRYGRAYPYYGGGYYGGYSPWYPWYYPSDYAYGPYWGAYYYGYWPYGAYYSGGGGYGGGYGRSYRSYRGEQADVELGGVRVLVDPDDAKVYVDGYYAGKVDDFDGIFQRLNLAEGRHEVLLKRDGYRSARFRIYVSGGATIKIEHDMTKGEGEEPLQDLTGGRGGEDPDHGAYAAPRRDDDPRSDSRRDDANDDAARPARGRDDDTVVVRPERGGRIGTLRLDVQPSDASIYVDGEFRGTARQLSSLELSRGPHRIEIVRPGFRTEQREIVVDPGQTRDLEVELARP